MLERSSGANFKLTHYPDLSYNVSGYYSYSRNRRQPIVEVEECRLIDRSEILRPRWQLALFAVLLLGWFVLGSVIEMLYAQLDGMAAQKLTFEQAKSIIATRPLWAGPVLFLIIAAMVADQLYRKKASLSAVFGEQGLRESLPESKVGPAPDRHSLP